MSNQHNQAGGKSNQGFDSQQHLQQLVAGLQENLQQANKVIQQSLQQSNQVMHQLQQQVQNLPAAGTSEDHAGAGSAEPNTGATASGVDTVSAAVQQASEHEKSMFGEMQQYAQQHFQEAEKALHLNPGQATSPKGFLQGVSNALHGVEQLGEQKLGQLQESAHQHMVNAEQAIQQSLHSIHNAIEGQRSAMGQVAPQPAAQEQGAGQPEQTGQPHPGQPAQ